MPIPKITLITLDYPPNRGGVARYLKNLVDASKGEIEVIEEVEGARWWSLVPMCRAQKDKIILVSHVFPVGTAAWISKILGGPAYVVLFHGLDLRLARGTVRRFLLRRICANAKALFVNSRATGSELRRLAPRVEYVVLTPGVEETVVPSRNDARQRLGIDHSAKLVVSVARLVSRKGIDVALKAVANLQKSYEQRATSNEPQYVVVGDGPDRDRLGSLAKEHRTRVRWILNADDREKWDWMAAADVFLLPVRDDGDDVEGFGIVFIEAALAGVPSIAGRSGGATEAVVDGETGILVDPMDIKEVTHAIEKLLNDTELRDRMGTNAKARAMSDFRWSERWDKMKRLLA